MSDADNDNGPYAFMGRVVTVEFEFNQQLRDLMDVAKVAIGPSMPQANPAEALVAVRGLLALVDRNMPPDLQAQDRRVAAARKLERDLVQLLK